VRQLRGELNSAQQEEARQRQALNNAQRDVEELQALIK